MHHYRTHTCGELTETDINTKVKLSGWIHSKRDHGGLLFIDLRDQYGITQIVVDKNNKEFSLLEHLRLESVVTITQCLNITALTSLCQLFSIDGKFLERHFESKK